MIGHLEKIMNPLIEMYKTMMNDPKAYESMVDPAFKGNALKQLKSCTPEQHEEFDVYVEARLQIQLTKLKLGELRE